MERKSPISDATISRNVTRQLSSSGLRSPCRIQVQTRNGEVTLSGTVQFVHQKNAAVQAIRTVEGVKRIVEKIKVTPPPKHQYTQPANRPTKEPPVEEAVVEEADTDEQEESPADESNESDSLAPEPEAVSSPVTDASADDTFTLGQTVSLAGHSNETNDQDLHHTRKGESYTFECVTREEAEKLRAVLATYADWLKKNSWVGQAKADGDVQRVTFHAKSVIDFLRQEGF